MQKRIEGRGEIHAEIHGANANPYKVLFAPVLAALIVERRNQEHQQRWIQNKPMQKRNKRTVVAWPVNLQHKIREQKQDHPNDLHVQRKNHIFPLLKQRVDQADGKSII